MALHFQEGKSLASNLLADLQAAILTCTDWSRPNSGTRPTTYKATTTRGAQMIIDLADAAIGTQRLTLAFYTSYDGTTLGTKIGTSRYLNYKFVAGGTTATNYVYWTLSLSKEHFFLMIEGPRPNDANADNSTYGSWRDAVFMCDLVPYFDSGIDPDPVIIAGASRGFASGASLLQHDHKANVSWTIADAAWGPGCLASLDFPNNVGNTLPMLNRNAPDGNIYLSPYVYFDDTDGIRGRLSHLFYAGLSVVQDVDNVPISAPVGSFQTYDGIEYKIVAPYRTYGAGSVYQFGPLGNGGALNGNYNFSPLVAIPYALAP